MLPSLFLAHGSPMLALEDTAYTRFLRDLGQTFSPKAIVIFTAHWESERLTISSRDDEYETIYDFYGFPEELYRIEYPAKGSSQLAARLQQMFAAAGIAADLDKTRGLDHGAWTLLYRMYPTAQIPVVQLSVNPYLSAEAQYQIGQALRSLGEEDILVIGSGVTVHNLRLVQWGQSTAEPWAVEFDDWLLATLGNRDLATLFDYARQAPHAHKAVPRPEHFVPFLIALGSGGNEATVLHRSYDLGSLSYLSIEFSSEGGIS
ncbi:DODA-type extradiol aromatic ring-opening family dioxygenase [Brevibacillus fulvus]|nr:class III extradiol ring-cleavage dioxygenase [Brevibacillus fulvus]